MLLGLAVYNSTHLALCASRDRIAVQPFHERHGLRGAMVAPTKIIAGLGLSLGLELLACPGATGDYRSDFGAKVGLLDSDSADSTAAWGWTPPTAPIRHKNVSAQLSALCSPAPSSSASE